MINQLSVKYEFGAIDTAYLYNTDGKVTNLALLSIEFKNVQATHGHLGTESGNHRQVSTSLPFILARILMLNILID